MLQYLMLCVHCRRVPPGVGPEAAREQHAQREEAAGLTAERHRDAAGRRHGSRGAAPGHDQLLLTLGPGSADPDLLIHLTGTLKQLDSPEVPVGPLN